MIKGCAELTATTQELLLIDITYYTDLYKIYYTKLKALKISN